MQIKSKRKLHVSPFSMILNYLANIMFLQDIEPTNIVRYLHSTIPISGTEEK